MAAAKPLLLRCILGVCVCALLLASIATTAAEQTRPATGGVLVVGDSISAAYGMSLAEGWVALLAEQLKGSYPQLAVVNASISGETSAGAAARLPQLLQAHQPSVVIIELGGNDGLRGYPIKRLRQNLRGMTELAQAGGARVLLLGMQIPPNYGSRYSGEFYASYARVATQTDSALVPFLLEGIATDSALMQADGIHPQPDAQPRLLANLWPQLQPLLPALQ